MTSRFAVSAGTAANHQIFIIRLNSNGVMRPSIWFQSFQLLRQQRRRKPFPSDRRPMVRSPETVLHFASPGFSASARLETFFPLFSNRPRVGSAREGGVVKLCLCEPSCRHGVRRGCPPRRSGLFQTARGNHENVPGEPCAVRPRVSRATINRQPDGVRPVRGFVL